MHPPASACTRRHLIAVSYHQAMLNRYEAHTKNCAPCRWALAATRRWAPVAAAAAALCGLVAAACGCVTATASPSDVGDCEICSGGGRTQSPPPCTIALPVLPFKAASHVTPLTRVSYAPTPSQSAYSSGAVLAVALGAVDPSGGSSRAAVALAGRIAAAALAAAAVALAAWAKLVSFEKALLVGAPRSLLAMLHRCFLPSKRVLKSFDTGLGSPGLFL